MRGGKIIAASVSVLLVVGICIGVAVGVQKNKNHGSGDGGKISSGSKAVAAICEPTDYKQVCADSLSSVAKNDSATPKDFILAAFEATLQEVKSAMNRSKLIGQSAREAMMKMAFDDCQDLLQFAVDELQTSFSTVRDNSLNTINDRVAEILNWLSAVVSYQETCMDQVIQEDLKKELTQGLLNATQLTSNALAIITEISGILANFGINGNVTIGSRKLLGVPVPEVNGYPTWFSGADRKLMADQASGQAPTPNAVVAKDGSGHYSTITDALKAYPENHQGRYVIYVKAGVYNEYVVVTKDQVNVFMYGDGSSKTVVTGNKNVRDGVTPMNTAPFAVQGQGFIGQSMGFQNTAGPEGHQAVALRVQADQAAFFNCKMEAYQDTLYAQALRQFYRDCEIAGTVDFIYGDSNTLVQNCMITVRLPMKGQQNTVTAQGRKLKTETTSLVIQNCQIVPDQRLYPGPVDGPELPRTTLEGILTNHNHGVYSGDLIQPAGWLPWKGNFALDTLFYAEYANRGAGANTAQRVKWPGYKVITNAADVQPYTATSVLLRNGQDDWLKPVGIPYQVGLTTS